ncbi:ADP-ribosylglycohydrolase family protein [Isoptericola sp. b490]|uniref:ADP-ribosylglycohydrolase family protein n=1 Tax=Actinotalea lenta TaxID=3064654 RepID=UPI002712A1D0|nr:ADP-ribosylglycohydrolase family protein [Isoptericola sp. b490]MDO8119735.1 ADP-ribosylglycohydrolase family protein [Isoptericola sp. b490]
MTRTSVTLDRAAGVLMAQAAGDALGVPYEGQSTVAGPARMLGGGYGPYEPGEYSDDTQMAVVIAQIAATGADLRSPAALDAIADGFLAWYRQGATDVGIHTRQVLSQVEPGPGSAGRLTALARDLYRAQGRGGGNGALMRTGIVGLANLTDRVATAEAARAIASLTHGDPEAGDSAVLWSEAVRVAGREGRFELAGGLDLIPAVRRTRWAAWIEDAAGADPASIPHNGHSPRALQAAWAAITSTLDDPTRTHPCEHLTDALQAAVHAGHDTDTVAAIAGALLGARWGGSAVPAAWRRAIHGWPGLRATDLTRLGILTARGGRDDERGWPSTGRVDYPARPIRVPHPFDDGVILGNQAALDDGWDAVVSLCRRGRAQGTVDPSRQVDVWLMDSEDPEANPNLDFVLDDTAHAIAALRADGHTVFVHCAHAEQRTPTVAIRYARLLGIDRDQARAGVAAAIGPTVRAFGHLWDQA